MKKICGIYKIISPDGKIYIGQSLDVLKRWAKHKRSIKVAAKTKLINSFLKHGIDSHVFKIIEVCETRGLKKREKYWIKIEDTFKSSHGLNCTKGGGKFGKASKETKLKNSETQKLKYSKNEYNRFGENNGMYKNGDRLRGEKNGRYMKEVSVKTRKRISKANKEYWDKQREKGLVYENIRRKYDHKEALKMHEEGKSHDEIMRKLKIKNKASVTYIIKKSLIKITKS